MTTPKGTKAIAFKNVGITAEKLMNKKEELRLKREIFERANKSLLYEISRIEDELKIHSYLMKFGWLYVSLSSTDCDCVQSYSVHKFQSIKRYHKFCESVYNNAEGATYINIISKTDYNQEREQPTRSRDRIMEAYENGNGRSIIV